jgi:phosphoserine phosphatase
MINAKFKTFRKALFITGVLSFFLVACQHGSEENKTTILDSTTIKTEPLPSWNEPLRSSIIAYVEKISKEGSADFVPLDSRIATFDNDGTLWAEKPYVQEMFAMNRVKEMVKADPSLASKQPFKAVLEHDKSYFEKGGDKALIELVVATHTSMTEDEFEKEANDFVTTATYPRAGNPPLSKIVYQPQIELLNYLRANGFKVFIVTGGTIELVRAISEKLYGVPKENVVGTTFKYEFDDSSRNIIRKPAIDLFNDQNGKPVGIQIHIGQRPIFSVGNEGGKGDIAMCEYCQSNHYPSFQMIVNHDDSTREYFYQEKDSASLKACVKNNWHIINMKQDWKTVFPN